VLYEAELITAENVYEEFIPVSPALAKTIEALSESPYKSIRGIGAGWWVHIDFFLKRGIQIC
jgi:hypothetical protein